MLAQRFDQPDETLHAPHLVDLELAHTLRRDTLSGILAPERARLALSHFTALSIARYPHTEFLDRIWQLRNNLSAYDAAYVALSEMLDAPLITLDRRLANASGHYAQIGRASCRERVYVLV